MSRLPQRAGDGDPCPQDSDHGLMQTYPLTRRQYCPHVAHKGEPFYEWDGVTPIERKGADTLAADLRKAVA